MGLLKKKSKIVLDLYRRLSAPYYPKRLTQPNIDLRRAEKGETEFPKVTPRTKKPWVYYVKYSWFGFWKTTGVIIDFLPLALMVVFGIVAIALFGPLIGVAIIGLSLGNEMHRKG